MAKDDIKSKRLSIERSFKRSKVVDKYSTIDNNLRICSVCGKKLTNYIINDPDFNYKGYYIAINKYIIFKKGSIIVPLCYDIKSCRG